MDDVEKCIRGGSLLLPPFSVVFKWLHTSREAVWGGMRAELPFLPVGKSVSKPGAARQPCRTSWA